ncbi:hypothetical protein CTAYLR_004468 [Chrysophaeum taylorii]|uniref:ABC transporter domain-containing protein n=1 Tax=Chrysophaeum taylorii TaxID=2483200 RepID=A0AAD7UCV7_9STRA|nr:hypothetical protein CTAYLR_004468 [Chrysophaeum taylorii]
MVAQFVLGIGFERLRHRTAAATDRRVRLTSEVIGGSVTVKMFGWQRPFFGAITGFRMDTKLRRFEKHNACARWGLLCDDAALGPRRVHGLVGSGKSTVLMALANELNLLKGTRGITGSVALCPQLAWDFSGTVKQNVMSGDEFDAVRRRTSRVETRVGKKGVVLRGCQSTRLTFVWCVYAYCRGAKLALLDDPLSAVEVHVAAHIVDHGICGYLSRGLGVGVILATHRCQLVQQHADAVTSLSTARVPQRGEVSLEALEYRYHSDDPLVLKGITRRLEVGSKNGVGVCGGPVIVDGVDVASIPLSRLQSIVATIPQARFQDCCWSDDGDDVLESGVEEGGANWSETATFCFSHALLLKRKIVAIDEATAFFDHETDAAVQPTLRSSPAFKSATLIVVAHRLQRIMDSVQVFVLQDGLLIESGAPEVLGVAPRFGLRAADCKSGADRARGHAHGISVSISDDVAAA